MKKLIILSLMMVLASCQMQIQPSKWNSKDAYTKHGFFYEKNRHLTTNYIRGLYVPPGTKVKVMAVGKTKSTLVINGAEIQIVNIEKYTHKDMEGVLDRLLSMTPVTPKVSDKYKVNLKTGQPSLGMTKEEVKTCIGYPPAHATPSLDSPTWKYWWSRFDTKELIFENNALIRIRN